MYNILGGKTLRKRLLIAVTICLILVTASIIEVYRSTWAVDSSTMTAKSNTLGESQLSWSPVWVAPLKTTVSDTSTGLVAALLRQSLSEIGLETMAAPQEVPDTSPLTGPVALFLSVKQWEVKRTLSGWAATATATTEGMPLGDPSAGTRIEINSNVSAAGKYAGWAKRSTVERHLAEQLAKKVTEGIQKDLSQAGLPLAPPSAPEKKGRFGFSFSWSRFSVKRSGEQLVTGVDHPLLLPTAKVDYYWSLPHQVVLAYRITIAGTELESKLLEALGERSSPHETFVDSINSRRRLFSPYISHYVPSSESERFGDIEGMPLDTVVERHVLIIAPK